MSLLFLLLFNQTYASDWNGDPNMIDDSLPPAAISTQPFEGYNAQLITAEEIQPEVAIKVYEFLKNFKQIVDKLNLTD